MIDRPPQIGAGDKLYCLDASRGLTPVWMAEDPAFADYCSLIAGDRRLLVVSVRGDVLLVDAEADTFRIVSRWAIDLGGGELYAHPAVAGRTLYLVAGEDLLAIDLASR